MEQLDYKLLFARIGRRHFQKRLARQLKLSVKAFSPGSLDLFLHLENGLPLFHSVAFLLKGMGQYNRGRKNTIDYQIDTIPVAFDQLPPAFHGFRILQLSDLHADAIIDGGYKLMRHLDTLRADLCVITGDFRSLIHDTYVPSMIAAQKIVEHIELPHGILGILGNHDFLEFVGPLEASGTRMLLNEAVPITREGRVIWMAGVDDAHLYACHDIPKALARIPKDDFTILLSHTPQVYREAETAGVDYLLCGHTHGGQICLPGGIPVITHAKCPRRYCVGSWRYKKLLGYTSRGTGSSGLQVRYNCRPELTIHELRCASTGRDKKKEK